MELPFPVTFKVYFFNVENSVDVVNGEKPVLKEVGPYIYKYYRFCLLFLSKPIFCRQYRKKTVLYTDEKEDTVSYTQTENFEFDNEASGNFSDEDYITMLNAPMMVSLYSLFKTTYNMYLTNISEHFANRRKIRPNECSK